MGLSILFIDVRGSTSLAEGLSATEFGRRMNAFYAVSTRILIQNDAFIDKMVGDEVMAVFIPAFTGTRHARSAVTAAGELLNATRAGGELELPVGVGVHSGVAFFGTIESAGTVFDLTALGDTVNLAARLASHAAPGEAVISEAAYRAAETDVPSEPGTITVKGKERPVDVRVLRPSTAPPS